MRLIFAALFAFVFAWPAQAQDRSYILATATPGGTYYPVGGAIATLVKVRVEPETGLALSAISSAGSAENVKLMRDGEAQFSILQGLYGSFARTGEGPFKTTGPTETIRAVTGLWRNVEHFVIARDKSETGTIADMANLVGERFSIGARNSGTEQSGRVILTNLGFDPNVAFDLAYLGYSASADALRNGTVDGVNLPAGTPVAAVTQIFSAMTDDAVLLAFTPEQAARADNGRNLWRPYTIPADTYPGQVAPITTIAQPNFLAVRHDVPADDVYAITKAMFENLTFLSAIHAAMKDLALETAIDGLPLPLHPGAARYFQEAGLDVPADLIAE